MNGTELKQIRIALRLNTRQMALIVDSSQSQIVGWEKGSRKISAEMACHMSKCLNDYVTLQIDRLHEIRSLVQSEP